MRRDDSLNMIGYIVSLIVSDAFDATITSLAEVCDVPIGKMRKYIAVIFKNKILRSYLSSKPDTDEDGDAFDDELDDVDGFLQRLCDGQADDELIYMTGATGILGDHFLVPVTAEQIGAIRDKYPEFARKDGRDPLFETKDAIDGVKDKEIGIKCTVEDAIANKKKIAFRYKRPSSNDKSIGAKKTYEDVICSPVRILHNQNRNVFHVKASDGMLYRLDRIVKSKAAKGKPYYVKTLGEAVDSYEPDPYEKYYWGAGDKNHGEPVHVKLRISLYNKNIGPKIESDLEYRRDTCKLYQDGDYLYYEDDIIGMDEFRKWMRGYGYSIKVLEPAMLIEKVKESATRTLGLYEKISDKV